MNPQSLAEFIGEARAAEVAVVVARIREGVRATEQSRRRLDRLVAAAVEAGASYGQIASAIGMSKSGVQRIVERGRLRGVPR